MMDAFLPVILGGVITLLTTSLVQVFVIPRVQRRTRWRERWENDVYEIRARIEEQFKPSMATYKISIENVWFYQDLLHERGDDAHFKELIKVNQEQARDASYAMSGYMRDLNVICKRLKRTRMKSPYWIGFMNAYRRLSLTSHVSCGARSDTKEQLEENTKGLQESLDRFTKILDELSDPPRPPRRSFHRPKSTI